MQQPFTKVIVSRKLNAKRYEDETCPMGKSRLLHTDKPKC